MKITYKNALYTLTILAFTVQGFEMQSAIAGKAHEFNEKDTVTSKLINGKISDIYELSGNVKEHSLVFYEINAGECSNIEQADMYVRDSVYHLQNEDGNLIQKFNAHEEVGIAFKDSFIYDETGKLIKVDRYRNGVNNQRFTFNFDDSGRIVEEKKKSITNDQGVQSVLDVEIRYSYQYDDQGRLVKSENDRNEKNKVDYNEEGNKAGVQVFIGDDPGNKKEMQYDDESRVIQKEYTTSSGSINRETYEYDEDGNLVLAERTGWPTWKRTYEFDSDGNKTRFTEIDGDSVKTEEVYKYDEAGNRIMLKTLENQQLTEKRNYEYDENGNRAQIRVVDSENKLVQETNFELDEHGNWITLKRCSRDGTMESLIKREITYY